MPDSNRNTQLKYRNQNPSELSPVPAVLLRFRKPMIVLAHIVAFAISLMLSFLVAKNMRLERGWFVNQYPALLLLFIIIKLPVFGLLKQYRGWWRYVGISDLFGIIKASVLSTIIIFTLWFSVVLNITPIRRHLYEIADVEQSICLIWLLRFCCWPDCEW